MTTDNTTDKKRKKKAKSGPRGEYKVVFKGKLLPGFDMEQVVNNIVQLTKLPQEKIEQKFFSGKVVIIRRAHDASHAQKLQQLFTNAGLEVFILKDETQKIKQEYQSISSKQKKRQFTKKIKKTVKKNNRTILATILWVVFLVMIVNLWNTYNVTIEVPDEVVEIESSLANKPLLFMTHINMERLLSRQNYLVGDTKSLPGTKTTIYSQLKQAGVDPKKAVKQVLSVAYIEDKKLISQTILLGQFPVNAMKQFFLDNFQSKVIPDADFVRLRISKVNEQTCQNEPFMELSIEHERILVSSDGYLGDLHQLLKQESGNITDLSNWKEYRSDKLISLAFFDPTKALNQGNDKTGGSPMSGLPMMMAQNLIKKNESVDSLYASVGLQLLPPAALFDLTLNSDNQSWLDQTQNSLMEQIEELKSKSSGLANLQLLLEKITFQKNVQQDLRENSQGDIGQLSMMVEMDSEFKKSIELAIRELTERFLSLSFGGDSSALTSTNSSAGITEKLDKAPQKYWPQYNKSKFKPFNEELDQFFKPVWIDGPFAISIDELLLESHDEGDQVLLQLRGKGQNIDNVGNKQAKIRVTEVSDQQGENVLAKLACGQPSILDDGFFTSWGGLRTAYLGDKKVNYNELEVRQKIKLKKGVKFSQVKILKGQVELNLATQTQSKEIAKSNENIVITDYETRILFTPSAPDSLSYTISGDENKILAVRALNKNRDYLSSMSRSSMDNLFGSGVSVSQQYQGEIAFIEVVYATKYEKIEYPFEISKFPPYPSDDQWKYELEFAQLSSIKIWNEKYQDIEPLNMEQDSANNWNGEMQASWSDGPLNLTLYGLKTSKHFGTSGQLHIKTPVIDELKNNLSALEIFIRYPQADENGKVGHSYYYPLKAKGYYMNGEFVPDRDKPYMDGQFSFKLPYKNEDTPLSEINGDIIIHLPVSKHSSSFTDMTIGAEWEDEGVRTKMVRLGNDVMEFEVFGNREQLLQITLIDSNKQRISTTDIQQSAHMQSKGGNIVVNYHGIPVKALLTVSEGQQTKRYPFNLKLK
ncbi:MAG: hypothetical protein OQL19_09320 [Gammaproteobacteria bacterium]|nr:hypothetical protein [Gammaproteobacteria bacterium]